MHRTSFIRTYFNVNVRWQNRSHEYPTCTFQLDPTTKKPFRSVYQPSVSFLTIRLRIRHSRMPSFPPGDEPFIQLSTPHQNAKLLSKVFSSVDSLFQAIGQQSQAELSPRESSTSPPLQNHSDKPTRLIQSAHRSTLSINAFRLLISAKPIDRLRLSPPRHRHLLSSAVNTIAPLSASSSTKSFQDEVSFPLSFVVSIPSFRQVLPILFASSP